MKIGYIGGFWATNIGNSFYNLGALYLLKKIYGNENVYFIPDPPGWFWNTTKNYDFISKVNLDLIYISGPCLNYKICKVYKKIFDNLKKRNIKIAFISAGASSYTKEEANFVQEFIQKYSIKHIITRDEETYNLYKSSGIPIFNGLCTSMFLNDAENIIPIIEKESYYVKNFSFLHEPNIDFDNNQYIIKKGFIFNFQQLLNGLDIIRTNNSIFCRIKYFLYNRKNTYYSDLPYGYLSILKNARSVFSDRVHSCAATLILGGKAMYIKGSKRSHDGRNSLFNRIRVNEIYNKPVSLDFEYINMEKDKMIKYLEENK